VITDPSHEYLLRQLIQRNAYDMTSGFIPYVFDPDTRNRHDEDRRTWLDWQRAGEPGPSMRYRLGQAIARFGHRLAGGAAATPARP
jgi:hypothetical protein